MDAPLRRSTRRDQHLDPPSHRHTVRAGLDFEALYRAARDDVFAYVATLLGDRSAAEDVTASAFERAYRRQRTYKSARGLRARLAVRHRPQRRARRAAPPQAQRRADRRARRRRRAPRRRTPPTPRCAAPRCAPPSPTLPPRERELIALKFHAGLDNAELAAVLGVSVSNAGTMLHRAVTKLRKAIDEHA